MRVETADAAAIRGRDDTADATAEDTAVWVGVTRSPPGWFRRRVDRTEPAAGLTGELTAALDRRRRELRMRGLCAEGAHNAAWEELGVDSRYRETLSREAARTALRSVASVEQPVVLATTRRPGFRCHRGVLADVLREWSPEP
jgi:hypothetical protein